MRVLFSMAYCPYCNMAKRAVMLANMRLVDGSRIDVVDIFSGDPRLRVLAEVFGSDKPEAWAAPIMVLDVDEGSGMFLLRRRVVVQGASEPVHMSRYILNLLRSEVV